MPDTEPVFTIEKRQKYQTGAHPIITVTVKVANVGDQREVQNTLQFISSPSMREKVANLVAATPTLGLTNHGIQTMGGFRPVHADDDRSKPVVAYERDYKFTKNI